MQTTAYFAHRPHHSVPSRPSFTSSALAWLRGAAQRAATLARRAINTATATAGAVLTRVATWAGTTPGAVLVGVGAFLVLVAALIAANR